MEPEPATRRLAGVRVMRLVLGATMTGAIVACSTAGPQLTDQPSPTPYLSEITRPTEVGELVVRVETLGGLLPPLEKERTLPAISIYGDGLVLVPGPVDAIFPGPAGYELLGFRIDAELLDDIVAEAVAIGLHGPHRSLPQDGPDFVVDGGATVITVVTNSVPHVTSAEALFDTHEGSAPERRFLVAFVQKLFAMQAAADLAPYAPDGYRVYVAAADPGFGPGLESGQEVAWQFVQPLAEWGEPLPADGLTVDVRCRVVIGDELEAALQFLRSTTVTTIVVDEPGDRSNIAYRPLFPEEKGC